MIFNVEYIWNTFGIHLEYILQICKSNMNPQVLTQTVPYFGWLQEPVVQPVTTRTLVSIRPPEPEQPIQYDLLLPSGRTYHNITGLTPYDSPIAIEIRNLIVSFTEDEVNAEDWERLERLVSSSEN